MKRGLLVLGLCLVLLTGCEETNTELLRELEALILSTPDPVIQGIERPVNIGDTIEIGLEHNNKLDLDWSRMIEYPTYVTPTDTAEAEIMQSEIIVNQPFPTINPYGIYEIPIIFPVKPVFPDTLTSYSEEEDFDE